MAKCKIKYFEKKASKNFDFRGGSKQFYFGHILGIIISIVLLVIMHVIYSS